MNKKYLTALAFFGALTAQTAFSMDLTSSMSCDYPLPESLSTIQPNTVTEWANYAITKTFTYDYENYKEQFTKAKACFTPSGWKSFSHAMKASHNLKSMKEEHLIVNAKINGETQLIAQFKGSNPPFWVVRVPITVTCHNEEKQLSENMTVDINIKTIPGNPLHFGINQMIAMDKELPAPVPVATNSIS